MTDARLAALEEVAKLARNFLKTFGMTSPELDRAFAALDGLSAPAQAQAQGETVAVWLDEGLGEYRFVVPGGHLDNIWLGTRKAVAIYVRRGTTFLPIRATVESSGK
jgi:hypothetical protein